MSLEIPRYKLLDNDQIRVSSLLERHVPKYFPTHRHQYYEMVIITSCVEGDFFFVCNLWLGMPMNIIN